MTTVTRLVPRRIAPHHNGRGDAILELLARAPGLGPAEIHRRLAMGGTSNATVTALARLRAAGRVVNGDGRWRLAQPSPQPHPEDSDLIVREAGEVSAIDVHLLLDLADAPEHADALQRLAMLVGAYNAVRGGK